jgi:hypothetical protein
MVWYEIALAGLGISPRWVFQGVGTAKNEILRIAPDFDAPLEVFKRYTE